MTRPRFSLRGLLLLIVAVAAFCWYRDLPRQNADRFARLLEAGDRRAFSMIKGGDANIKGPWGFPWKWTVKRRGQTPGEWLHGQYAVYLTADTGNGTYSKLLHADANGVWESYKSTFINRSLPPFR